MKFKPVLIAIVFMTAALSASCLASIPYGEYGAEPSQGWNASSRLKDLARDLADRAAEIADRIDSQIDDRYGSWADNQMDALFAADHFAAAGRTFYRLAGRLEYGSRASVRPGLQRAYRYLLGTFRDLESAARGGTRVPSLYDCSSLLRRIEQEIGGDWGRPSPDMDQVDRDRLKEKSWEGKYAKGRGAAVYLIERSGPGDLIRRPFKDLESLFKYNFDQNRGNNPWGHVADIPQETLDRMRTGETISRSFEGLMVIEPGSLPNRSVYLIQGGKKRGLSKPDLVTRYGGWKKVYEIPKEIIRGYPDGDPIQ